MADLRTILRQAVTLDERCDAVRFFVAHCVPIPQTRDTSWARKWGQRHFLVGVVHTARSEKEPALLLGAVVALVPSGWSLGFDVVAAGVGPDFSISSLSRNDTVYEQKSRNPECAIALAILDAIEATNG